MSATRGSGWIVRGGVGVALAAGLVLVGCRGQARSAGDERAPADAEAAGRAEQAQVVDQDEGGHAPKGARKGKRDARGEARFVVVKGDAAIHAGAEGDGVPGTARRPDLGGTVPGVVLRMLEARAGRILVETVSSSATPTEGCGVGIEGLDPYRLRFWVDAGARVEVVTERFRSSYPDVTTVELLAGTPVRQLEGGTWVADVWGATIDLARAPRKRGLDFGGLDHLTGSPKGHLPLETKLRVGDARLPVFLLVQDAEGIVHFGEDRGLYWVQMGCVQLLAATDGNDAAEMPISLGLAGGGRGRSLDPKLGMHRLSAGAPVFWRDGRGAGEVRGRHLMAGEQETGGTTPEGHPLACYHQPYANGRSGLELCVDPQAEGVEPLAWIPVRVASATWPKSIDETGAISAVDPEIRAMAAADLIRRCVAMALDDEVALAESAQLELKLRRRGPRTQHPDHHEVARVEGRVLSDPAANRSVHACVTEAANDRFALAPGFAEATFRLGE